MTVSPGAAASARPGERVAQTLNNNCIPLETGPGTTPFAHGNAIRLLLRRYTQAALYINWRRDLVSIACRGRSRDRPTRVRSTSAAIRSDPAPRHPLRSHRSHRLSPLFPSQSRSISSKPIAGKKAGEKGIAKRARMKLDGRSAERQVRMRV